MDNTLDFLSFRQNKNISEKKLRVKLGELQDTSKETKNVSSKNLVQNKYLNLCSNAIDYVSSLEQDVSDLEVILGATIQHNTDLENELNKQNDHVDKERQKYEFIVNASRDWMCLIDKKYNFEAVNESFCKIQNTKKEKAEKLNLKKLFGTKLFNEKIKAACDKAFQGQEIRDLISLSFSKKAESKHYEVGYYPFRNQNNAISHVVFIAKDISEKTQLEEEFYRAQRTDSIGTLASEIAHELNNVLTLFFMSIGALKPKLPDVQSQTMLSLLESSAKRGGELVRQILKFAKGIEPNYLKTDLKELLLEFQDMPARTFPKNINFVSNIAADLKPIYANPTQIYQVLLNLCINSRDAMPDGGEIVISSENIEIKKQSKKYAGAVIGSYVLISTADTGVGIPKKNLAKIFQPFFTTKSIDKGTGLGLSTVQKIIKNHDGYIYILSDLGKGTRINILLPVYQE
jgi:two-component system, cell cycle sensor histidine kinase and response regulator CckA